MGLDTGHSDSRPSFPLQALVNSRGFLSGFCLLTDTAGTVHAWVL